MVEVYINGVLMELPSDYSLTITKETNFIGNLEDVKATRSYTITFDATKRNLSAIGASSFIDIVSILPYRKMPARIILDGLEITTDAKAYLISSKDDAFDIVIGWITTNVYTKIGSDKLTDIITKFPALYDYLPYQSTETILKPISQISDRKGYYYYNNMIGYDTNVKYNHPCVSAAYIFELIQTAYKISFEGIDFEELNNFLFPLVTNHASDATMEYQGLTSSAPVRNTVFPCRLFPALSNFKQMIDIFHPQTFEDSFYRNEYSDSFRFKCHIQCTAPNFIIFSDYSTGDIGDTIKKISTDDNNLFELDEIIEFKGDFLIHFYNGDIVNLSAPGTFFKVIPQYNKSLFYDNADNSDRYGRFDILANLPDMKISKFISDMLNILGAFNVGKGNFDDIDKTSRLEFVNYSDINKSDALDWSSKFIEVSEVAYFNDNSAKKMIMKYDGDDYSLDADDSFLVDSENIEDEKNLFELDLSVMDGYRLPLYTVSVNDGETEYELNDMNPKIGYKTQTTPPGGGANILGVTGVNANLMFKDYLKMIGIRRAKYQLVESIFQNYKEVTANFYLSAGDIYRLEDSVPIYVAKYGSYFMVTKLEYNVNSRIGKVTMIKIN